MEKLPLSQPGFDSLQNRLYQLSNHELQMQSNEITANFPRWMSEHFELSTQQIDHLKSLPAAALEQLSSQTAIAIQGRLKVSLIKPDVKPINSYDSKYIKTASQVRVLASDDDEFEAEGELVIQIGY
ncbi:hypothetical protein ASE92_06665 [Pedobacter sp. Leaf41]|uniref:hypothetical protein n=1 Tax=Pedobacter sp. Leaf41 TaxID=1736218 RepID=UPI000702EFEF|nr:hypothetical protein [Pedobacter sp. Leaf41]KQN35824.1 hypothetical protein ASE92_06665 [Pedobacter sp. Leaf41]